MITKKIKEGNVYAVHTGAYAGEMLIFIQTEMMDYCFLSVPNMENRIIPQIVFEHGIKTDIIKYVEKVPGYVIKLSAAQYNKNKIINKDSVVIESDI